MENWFTHFGTELLGTFILIILGNGIVANVVLKNTKGNNAGWLSITIGWSFAVIIGATIASALKGAAHLNPAVTIAFVVNGWEKNIGSLGLIPIFIIGQLIGAILAQIVIDIFYIKHITNSISDNKNNNVLAMHSTGPQYRNIFSNFFCEFFATLILVVGIFSLSNWFSSATWMGPIFVGFIVLAIGLSLGGTTGYAINPFRDLCPRIVHQLLPLKGKSNSDWSYSWIPVVAPMLAGIMGGALFLI
ncbi:MIP/aquaporin family protein [Spiroplasma turonicum]|uniref:Glycerol uptake facilitator protein n=1 Tax=Spiroplasma turonicum TaxID=216946 RepID=A0A0K1P7B3_9MOLU|nr:MIP/aquaporin family protein [Spiroplasma turonicum]AKU79792.1 glycerol uptake facilitator protein [Spiroplasma turonicum]ALX70810.1 glycerol uptake facilitator protein [Spiroplasma turonicum]